MANLSNINNKFIVTDGGNVLIGGNISGSSILQVTGNSLFTGNIGIGSTPVGNAGTNFLAVGTAGTTAGGIQLWAGSAQTHFLQFGDAATGTSYYKGAVSYNHLTDTLELLQDSVNALSFTGSQAATFAGDVGIGVTATKALQVSGEALFGNGTDGLLLTFSNGNSSGIIDTGFTSTALEFRTGGSERLTINSSTATFKGAVSSVGNITTDGIFKVDTAPDDNVLEVTQQGRKMALKTSFAGDEIGSFWAFRVSTGAVAGTMTDALIVRPLQANFAGNVLLNNNTGQLQSRDAAGTAARILTMDNADTLILGNPTTVDDIRFDVDTYGEGAMMILSSGNVGIGTDSPVGKLEIATTGSIAKPPSLRISNAAALTFLWDIWRDNTTGFLNIGSTTDGTDNGSHLTIKDVSGFVGIGTASPDAILHIDKDDTSPVLLVKASSQTGSTTPFAKLVLAAGSATGADVGSNITGYRTADFSSAAARSTGLKFGVLQNNVAKEAMRITEAQNVGIGTTSPDGKLQVTAASSTTSNGNDASYKLYLTNTDTTNNNYSLINFTDSDGGSSSGCIGLQYTDHTNDYGELCFITRGVSGYGERMRITSGGTTEFKKNVDILSDQNANMLKVRSTSGSYTSSVLLVDCDRTTTNNTYNLAAFTNAGTSKCIITDGGDLKNTNNSYGAISDERLKENITDATPKLDDLMKVKVRNFNMIGDDCKQIGVVAQELEEIFPSIVNNAKNFDSEDETLYKSVKYSVFVPMLIKSIQELKAEVDLLKNK